MATKDSGELRVGMVGYAFMGSAHSQAWRTVNRVFDLPLRVRMAAICGRDAANVAAAADRLGWDDHTTDWHELIAVLISFDLRNLVGAGALARGGLCWRWRLGFARAATFR